MTKHGKQMQKKINMLPRTELEQLKTMMKICNFLKQTVAKMSIKMNKHLHRESKCIQRKNRISRATNKFSWGDGDLLAFKEDHFIGSTGVRYRQTRV